MLQQMRDKAQNLKWILWAVILSFLVSFVVIFQGGLGGMSMREQATAATVADQTISFSQLQNAMRRQEDMLRQMFGNQANVEQFMSARGVLDSLIDRAILLEEAKRAGIRPSKQEIARQIKEIDAFHDDQGRFDKSKYVKYLTDTSQRAVDFENLLAEDLAVAGITRLLEAGASVPTAAVKEAWKRENEKASAEWVAFPLEAHVAAMTASDDELKAWYDAHQKDYDAGPARRIRHVRFSRDAFQKGLEKEADMRAYYDENAATIYTMGEDQRRASVILVSVPAGADEATKAAARAKAEAAAARAKAGEDFAALARELSDDAATREKGGDLGPFYQGYQEPAVETAVFGASEGDVVGPVETLRGFEVLAVTKGAGTKVRPFEDVRDLVARGLYAKDAAEAQAAAVKKFQDALAGEAGGDFAQAAQLAGVEVSEPAWITRTDDIPGLGANPLVTSQAFELAVKSVSEPISDVGGQIVIEVMEARETSPKSFDEARAEVETAVKRDKARAAARAEAEAFRQAASAAATLADAAAGRTVATAADVRRGRPVEGVGNAPDFVAVAFETPVGQLGRVADTPDGAAVLRVTERTEFDEAKFEADRDGLAQRLRDQQVGSLRSSILEQLRKSYESRIEVNEELLAALEPRQAGG